VLPVDPTSGGTWVAANDAGLALALLNVNANKRPSATPAAPQSRGKIIPALLHADTPLSATFFALTLDPAQYAPFRLVLVNRREGVEVHSDGARMRLVWRFGLTRPLLFTSSGLGDQAVERPRRQLFGEFFDPSPVSPEYWGEGDMFFPSPQYSGERGRGEGDRLTRQDAFHRHRWPDRPDLSVCMDRPDARTVSYTVVCLGPDRVTLSYHPDAPDRPAEAVTLTLPIAVGGVA
jgi:hypothetical protein